MSDEASADRLLTDGQTAGLLILAAVVVAAAPIALGADTMLIFAGGVGAFLLIVIALGIASSRAEYGEPPRRTG